MTDDVHDDTPGDGRPDDYRSAMTELESILQELERDDVDVDTLAERVRRAGSLLAFCRTRIDAARLEIEQIVEGIDDAADAAPSASISDEDEPEWDVDEGTLFGDDV